MEVKQFKPGDKVTVTQRGAIGWESGDWSLRLIDDKIYTVFSTSDSDSPSLTIEEDKLRYDTHPNHFTLVESTPVQDNYNNYLEERIEALEQSHKTYKELSESDSQKGLGQAIYSGQAAGIWDTIVELRNALVMYTQNQQP